MKTKQLKRTLAGVGLALSASVLAVPNANAVLITQWDSFTNDTFSAFAPAGAIPNGVEGSAPNAALLGSTVLSWGIATGNTGNGTDPSSLSIGNSNGNAGEFNGQLFINADGTSQNSIVSSTLTHANEEITGASVTLDTATLSSSLALTPVLPPGIALPTQFFDFDIDFVETPNFPASGVCEGGGAVPPGGCNDIFALVGGDDLSIHFMVDDYNYWLDLTLTGLDPLTTAQCAVVGLGAGCVGFSTIEGQDNTLTISQTIRAEEKIPEPAILSLLGIGMVGLGYMRRRQNKN